MTRAKQVSRHLDRHGIATRSGHHCAQPALRHFGLEQTVRASLAFYNTKEDVDTLIHGFDAFPNTEGSEFRRRRPKGHGP